MGVSSWMVMHRHFSMSQAYGAVYHLWLTEDVHGQEIKDYMLWASMTSFTQVESVNLLQLFFPQFAPVEIICIFLSQLHLHFTSNCTDSSISLELFLNSPFEIGEQRSNTFSLSWKAFSSNQMQLIRVLDGDHRKKRGDQRLRPLPQRWIY